MSNQTITERPEKGALVYSTILKFNKVDEYGISLQDVGNFMQSDKVSPVRIDVQFEGEITEGLISGKISGTDYLTCNTDGTLSLILFERIVTPIGEAIAYQGTGKAIPTDDPAIMKFTQDVTLTTHEPNLSGLNGLKLIGEGHVKIPDGEVHLSLHVA
jgi:hypothetical protein